ncbi:MAG: MrpF/PhaF family protein, partial [Candidatus Absconditabacteria bacterium]
DIHAMDLNWSIIEKRIFYNIELGNLIIKQFDENEITDKIKYDNFVKKCRINNLKPDQMLRVQDGKKIIDKNKYLKHFLEIKITKNGLTRIDEINREIKDMVKNNTRLFKNVKKIQKVIDNSPVYASIAIVVGCLGFVGTVLFSGQDIGNVNPNMQSANILDKDGVDGFYKTKGESEDFNYFKAYFENNFKNESSKIKDLKWNTYSKSQGNNITIFKVQLGNKDLFFKLDKSNNNISIERIYEF